MADPTRRGGGIILRAGSAAPCFQLYEPAGEAVSHRMCGNRDEEFVLGEAGRHSILVTE